MPMLIVSGLAPDLDYASYFGGPEAFLHFHRTALHSIAGATVAACAIAGIFCAVDRKFPAGGGANKKTYKPLGFGAALLVCAVGAAGHLLLDLASGIGIRLLWPFRAYWSAWDLVTDLDPWILALLIAGLLVPMLFKLINEEVGERKKAAGVSKSAVFTLLLVLAYFGVREKLHNQAIGLLLSREYHGQVPLTAGAFPLSSNPFEWRGVVVTDNTIEQVEVPVGPGDEFDSDRSVTEFKPEDSPALDAGEKTEEAREYLTYARFPLATVSRREGGYRFEVHDLRFAGDDTGPSNIFVLVDFDSELQVKRQEFRFASSPNP
jgi:inner membrane protein